MYRPENRTCTTSLGRGGDVQSAGHPRIWAQAPPNTLVNLISARPGARYPARTGITYGWCEPGADGEPHGRKRCPARVC